MLAHLVLGSPLWLADESVNPDHILYAFVEVLTTQNTEYKTHTSKNNSQQKQEYQWKWSKINKGGKYIRISWDKKEYNMTNRKKIILKG